MRHFSLARPVTGLVAAMAFLFLLAGTSTTEAVSAATAKNLTRVGYIYTYPIMLTYREMYADIIAKGPPYKFNQFVIQEKLPDPKVRPPHIFLPSFINSLPFSFQIVRYCFFSHLFLPISSLHTDGRPQRGRGLPDGHRLARHPR